jgi:tetratricopeptide (TPR) repeat protein
MPTNSDSLTPLETFRLLQAGIAAAKTGQRERARGMLLRVIEHDEENVTAWLWLSGLVDDLEERQICLENVVALEPDNALARKGLDHLQRQRETAPPPLEANELEPEERTEPAVARPYDAFDDEYLCPNCTAETEPKDRRCKECGAKLWINFRKREKRSTAMWITLALQAYTTLQSLVLPVLMGFLLFSVNTPIISDFMELYTEQLGVQPAEIEMWIWIGFFLSFLPFLFALSVLIGLFLRWKPVFYLLLVNALLGVLFVSLGVVTSVLSTNLVVGLAGGGYVGAAVAMATALARLFLAFQLEEDFPMERRRILFRLDPDVNSAPMILARGHEYAERKMWGLAALHMRRAVGMTPQRMDGRLALALTYIKLKRYDLAAGALERARQIAPSESEIDELEAFLERKRAGRG